MSEGQEGLKSNPWFSIWVRPRETISEIVAYNVSHCFYILAFIYGLNYMFGTCQYFDAAKSMSVWWGVLMSVILAFPVGWIALSLVSWVMLYLGKLLGGKGSYREVRASVAWANVPNVINIALWIIYLLVFGKSTFMQGFTVMEQQNSAYLVLQIGMIIQGIIGVWSIVILVLSLGRVQKYSAWMGLLNVLLTGIILGLIFVLATRGLLYLMGG